MLAGAHVADGAGALAVAGESGGGQRVQRHAFGAAGEQRLADTGPPEDPLQRPDVEVLARMRTRHEREFGGRKIERVDAARFDEGHEAERLDARPKGDEPIGVAEDPHNPSVDVGLNDVPAVLALHDPAADLSDKDGRRDAG